MKPKHARSSYGKSFALITVAALIILMPEDMAHLLAVLIHYAYESLAFVIEHLLVHSLGLSKFQAQMAVFYGSCGIGAVLAYTFWRRLPAMLSAAQSSVEAKWQQLQLDLLLTWQMLPWPRKAKILLIQLVGVGGSLMYLVA